MSVFSSEHAESPLKIRSKSLNNADEDHPLAMITLAVLRLESLAFEAISTDLETLRGAVEQDFLCSDEGETLRDELTKEISELAEKVDAHLGLICEAE